MSFHLGLCPISGKESVHLNLQRTDVQKCDEGRTFWVSGENMSSAWHTQSPADWLMNANSLEGYLAVQPKYPKNETDNGLVLNAIDGDLALVASMVADFLIRRKVPAERILPSIHVPDEAKEDFLDLLSILIRDLVFVETFAANPFVAHGIRRHADRTIKSFSVEMLGSGAIDDR